MISQSSKSQSKAYLEMPRPDFSFNKDLDILKWWNDHCIRFPILTNIACDFMSIPITTMAFKLVLSIERCVKQV